jgi:hypothetical protein
MTILDLPLGKQYKKLLVDIIMYSHKVYGEAGVLSSTLLKTQITDSVFISVRLDFGHYYLCFKYLDRKHLTKYYIRFEISFDNEKNEKIPSIGVEIYNHTNVYFDQFDLESDSNEAAIMYYKCFSELFVFTKNIGL